MSRTSISAPRVRGKEDRSVSSSSAAASGRGGWPGTCRVSDWAEGGRPVMGSSLRLRVASGQEGLRRRSPRTEVEGEEIVRGMSGVGGW